MILTFLQIWNKTAFLQVSENQSNDIDVGLSWIFDPNKNVIKIKNDKNIEFFDQDFINVAVKSV